MTVLTIILLSAVVTQAILALIVLGIVRRQGSDFDRAEAEHLREIEKRDARIAELEARIRELTDWRPMETAPKSGGWISFDPRLYTHIRCVGPNGDVGWLPMIPLHKVKP